MILYELKYLQKLFKQNLKISFKRLFFYNMHLIKKMKELCRKRETCQSNIRTWFRSSFKQYMTFSSRELYRSGISCTMTHHWYSTNLYIIGLFGKCSLSTGEKFNSIFPIKVVLKISQNLQSFSKAFRTSLVFDHVITTWFLSKYYLTLCISVWFF